MLVAFSPWCASEAVKARKLEDRNSTRIGRWANVSIAIPSDV